MATKNTVLKPPSGKAVSLQGTVPPYKPDELEAKKYLEKRFSELQQARRKVGRNAINIEKLFDAADRAYEPHRIRGRGRNRLVQLDQDLGLRGSSLINVGKDNWRSQISKPNPYIQIQTALSIMVDSNPEAFFSPGASKFEATTTLIKNLYKTNWHVAKSKQQLKLMILNGAKYGIIGGRTYPLRKAKMVRDLVEFDPLKPEDAKYEAREDVEYDDVYRESLNPRHFWPDNNALPGDYMSAADWFFYKRYTYERAKAEFENYTYFEYVPKSTNIRENMDSQNTAEEKEHPYTDGVDAYFYENKDLDWYAVRLNGVWVIPREPLPTKHKKLSGYWGPWTLRDDATPYGIGVYEALRDDHDMLDKLRNMTMDQVQLSIYKMFLFSGTNTDDSTGKISLQPGVGKQISDANAVKFLDIPAAGQEAWEGIKYLEEGLQQDTGINDNLQGGDSTEKTAYQTQIAREAGLRRLKVPLDNIAECILEPDAYLTISLMEQKYSALDVVELINPQEITDYLAEIKNDPELFEMSEPDENGQSTFNAKVPKEMRLSMEEDENGNFVDSEKDKFFRLKPSKLHWEGMVRIEPQSILAQSKELQKQMDLELFNMLMPLLSASLAAVQAPPNPDNPDAPAPGRQYIDTVIKPIKNMLRQYDKDSADWLPNWWLQPLPGEQVAEVPPAPGQPPQEQGNSPLFVPPEAQGVQTGAEPNPAPQPPANPVQPAIQPTSLPSQVSAVLSPATK